MASFAEALFKAPTKSKRIADCLIHPEQYANTCMAVLIRRVTCESLFSFRGQRKVLGCKIYLRGLRPGFFLGGSERLSFFKLRPSQQPFRVFSGNLHFTHYTQGKYVIERKFMYL